MSYFENGVFWRLDESAFLDPITLALHVLWLVLHVLTFIDDIFSPLGSRGSLIVCVRRARVIANGIKEVFFGPLILAFLVFA